MCAGCRVLESRTAIAPRNPQGMPAIVERNVRLDCSYGRESLVTHGAVGVAHFYARLRQITLGLMCLKTTNTFWATAPLSRDGCNNRPRNLLRNRPNSLIKNRDWLWSAGLPRTLVQPGRSHGLGGWDRTERSCCPARSRISFGATNKQRGGSPGERRRDRTAKRIVRSCHGPPGSGKHSRAGEDCFRDGRFGEARRCRSLARS